MQEKLADLLQYFKEVEPDPYYSGYVWNESPFDASFAPVLINLLSEYDLQSMETAPIRAGIIMLLGAIGDAQTFEVVLKYLNDDHKLVRLAAAQALGSLGDKRAVLPLLQLLDKQTKKDQAAWHYSLSQGIISALGELKDSRATGKLIQILAENKSWYMRSASAAALSYIGGEEEIAALLRALRDRNEFVYSTVVRGLGRLGDTRAIAPLINNMRNYRVGFTSDEVIKTIAEFGELTLQTLLKALRKKKLRALAARALGRLHNREAILPMIKAFYYASSDEHIQTSIIWALAMLSDDAVSLQLLQKLATDEVQSQLIRETAKQALSSYL